MGMKIVLSKLQAALSYQKRGWAVFPLEGKIPKKGSHGFKDASINGGAAREWWNANPDDNIGIATGLSSGLIVIDIDPRNGGDKALAELEKQYGALPQTAEVTTGRRDGGRHLYFLPPLDIAVKSKKGQDGIAPGVEVCSTGAYVVAPPSHHPDTGKRYIWKYHPTAVPLATLPAWIVELANAERKVEPAGPPVLTYKDFYEKHIPSLKLSGDGSNAQGLCPFHKNGMEKDASFSANLSTGLFVCFTCNEKGNAQQFAQKLDVPTPKIPTSTSAGSKNQATRLAELANNVELFYHGDEGFASIPKDGHHETWPIRSKGFKLWLSKQFFDQEKRAPSSQALNDALNTIEGQAIHVGSERAVNLRVAERNGAIYLDLGGPTWEAVKITKTAWRVVTNPRVKFRRTRGMLPLPKPVRGGSIKMLRDFINVTDDEWPLFVACILAALRPSGPYPVLAQYGEQGSGKSVNTRVFRALIDPHKAPLRSEPSDPRDLMISAVNNRVLAFDNLSYLRPWLSDALCRISTGDGYTTRELYTNSDEMVFEAQCPIVLNGIEEMATRPDLIDRAVVLSLPVISKTKRMTEKEFWKKFEEARPMILGALLDAVSAALRNLPTVQVAELPRMADFAQWVTAAEEGLGWKAGIIMKAYHRNRKSASLLALEASPVAATVQKFIRAHKQWEGTASELLVHINALGTEQQRKHGWPSNPTRLSGILKRLAPNLRGNDVDIEFKHGKQRLISLDWRGKSASPPSSVTPAPQKDDDTDANDAEKLRHSKHRTVGVQ